jgi:hypothetical protein
MFLNYVRDKGKNNRYSLNKKSPFLSKIFRDERGFRGTTLIPENDSGRFATPADSGVIPL